MKNLFRLSSLLFLLLYYTLSVALARQVIPDDFDEWIQNGMEQWQIPGMAVAVVKDGEVILAAGYGVLKIGDSHPVDADTQFGIASVSKHMTASSLALLVEEGLISWKDPVVRHIPWFELSDPWATAHVTIHDLLTHQVGVGRILGNRLQFMTNRSREELLRHMRYHTFEQPFRAGYVYSNVMYTLAGEVVTAVTGQSWDSFMHERFFEPMDMKRTNTSILDLHTDGNFAWPHQYIKGEVIPIPLRNWDNSSPAGGVNSTAADMAKWMVMQLNNGVYNDIVMIPSSVLTDIQTPKVSLESTDVSAPVRSYGYGYNITDFRGQRVISHGGATDGMNTSYMLLPEHNFGIIIMTNTFNNFMTAVAYSVIDYMLGTSDRDWNALMLNNYQNYYDSVKIIREEFESTRITGTTTTHTLESYSGLFHNDLYDQAEVRYHEGSLILTIFDDEELTADLEHWHHNTFRVNWRNPAMREEFMQFLMDYEGQIGALEIRYSLRPMLLQVGAYPTEYYRDVIYRRID